MSYPLVSILIPAYNAERWIYQALVSAYTQTYRRTQIIVVDDGSTDRTLELVSLFTTGNVHVLKQKNLGASTARNAALASATGDYIQWLDADDVLARDKIERQMSAIRDFGIHPKTLVSGEWGSFRYRTSRASFERTALWENLTPVEWLYRKLRHNLHMQPGNWLMSRELADAAGPWDASLTHDDDGEYFARVIAASNGTHFVPGSRCYYRQVGFGSLSHVAADKEKLASLFRSMEQHIAYLLNLEDSSRTREACCAYIRTWLHEFYPYRPDIVEQLKQITAELDGEWAEPRLPTKYQWLVKTFGWATARKAQITLPRIRQTAVNRWDRLMYNLGIP